jgi:hypothetical protein
VILDQALDSLAQVLRARDVVHALGVARPQGLLNHTPERLLRKWAAQGGSSHTHDPPNCRMLQYNGLRKFKKFLLHVMLQRDLSSKHRAKKISIRPR